MRAALGLGLGLGLAAALGWLPGEGGGALGRSSPRGQRARTYIIPIEGTPRTVRLRQQVFLAEDFRIYIDGRGGLAKSELARIEVIVTPCMLYPTSLRTEQPWKCSRRNMQRGESPLQQCSAQPRSPPTRCLQELS
ncbi:uncharacterized protein WM294_012865 [Sarcoramphus papa]